VDARCCDGACAGFCQACNLTGHEGRCTVVPAGQPQGGRPPCPGADVCQGRCDGTSPDCRFPGGATSCTCPLLPPLSVAACDGTGHCATAAGVCL
jgi:hypothetical protein